MARKLPKGKVKQTFAVRIPAEQLAEIRRRAKRQKMDPSAWIRIAIDWRLARGL